MTSPIRRKNACCPQHPRSLHRPVPAFCPRTVQFRHHAAVGPGPALGRCIRPIPGESPPAVARCQAIVVRTAATCPDLAKAPSSPGQRVIVIVHGTGSCAISIADALMKAGVPTPIYRFEHDTFVPITSNARELATLVQRLGTQALVLVCHSRGGLVGRQAASLAFSTRSSLFRQCKC